MLVLRDWIDLDRIGMWLPETLKGRIILLLILFYPFLSLIPIMLTHSLSVLMLVVLSNLLVIPALIWWAVKWTGNARKQPPLS